MENAKIKARSQVNAFLIHISLFIFIGVKENLDILFTSLF